MFRRRFLLVPIVLALLVSSFATISVQPTTAAGTADLAVSVDGYRKVVPYGKSFSFTTTVTNLGPETATGVEVWIGTSDSLANFGGTCPDGKVSGMCVIGEMAPGAQVTVVFRVQAKNSCCPEDLGVAVFSVLHDADTIDPNDANDNVRVEIRLVGKA